SDSNVDVKTNAECSALDGLYSISPVSSQELLVEPEVLVLPLDDSGSRSPVTAVPQENPVLQGGTHSDLEAGITPSQQLPTDLTGELPNTLPTASPESEPSKSLPDALRALQEWILSHTSTGDLTVDAANLFLQTLNFCLEGDLLRCGAEKNSEQLKAILSRPGIWKAIDEHRQHLQQEGRAPETLEDIQHRNVWINLTKEGQPFLDGTNNIGLILMCDWFQPNSCQGTPSYSTGVISLCIANLPPHLRVQPENKIVVGVTPGPHEPNVDTINNFLEPMVHKLMLLWDESISIDNPDNSIARDVCAALVACACNSPATCKVGGFPGTGGTYPCTACWVSHKELHIFDQKFPQRTQHKHKIAAKAYSKLPNKAQQQKFLTNKFEQGRPGGYQPSILLNLPYWNPKKMVIINPMHCLFLGLVDWQFHTIWVEMKHLCPGKELNELQEMVQSTLWPQHCGRPPNGLGTSSAGSLTANPLRSLITIDLPLAIPVLWDKVDIGSTDQQAHKEWARRKQIQEKKQAETQKGNKITQAAAKAQHAQDNAATTLQATQKRPWKSNATQLTHISNSDKYSDTKALANATQVREDDASKQGYLSWRLEDDEGILLLASAIKLLGSQTVTKDGIKEGEKFLTKYLDKCTQLQGAACIHPNHHISTHISKQLS
ncbi:hypothetical protein RHS03_00368, partial [Rhizoctonia solani]